MKASLPDIPTLWSHRLSTRPVSICMGADRAWCVIAEDTREVVLVDEDGSLVWSRAVDNAPLQVVGCADGENVLVLQEGGCLDCFGSEGSQVWRIEGPSDAGRAAINAAGTHVAFTRDSSRIEVVRIEDGSRQLAPLRAKPVDVALTPGVAPSAVVVLEDGHAMLFGAGGRRKWDRQLQGSLSRIQVVEDRGELFLTSYMEGVYVLDLDGNAVGAYEIGSPLKECRASRGGSRLAVCTEDNTVQVMDRLAKVLWKHAFGAPVSGMAIDGTANRLCVGIDGESVHCFDLPIEKKSPPPKPLPPRPHGIKISVPARPIKVKEIQAEGGAPEPEAPEREDLIEEEVLGAEDHLFGDDEPLLHDDSVNVPAATEQDEDIVEAEAVEDEEDAESPPTEEAVRQEEAEEVVEAEEVQEEEGEEEFKLSLEPDEPIAETGPYVEVSAADDRVPADGGLELAEEEEEEGEEEEEERAKPIGPARWRVRLGSDELAPDGLQMGPDGNFVGLISISGVLEVLDATGAAFARGSLTGQRPRLHCAVERPLMMAYTQEGSLYYDCGTGAHGRFTADRRKIKGLCLSANGKVFTLWDSDNRIIWGTIAGDRLWRRKCRRSIRRVALSPRGNRLVAQDNEGRFLIYDSEGKLTRKFRTGGSERYLSFDLTDEAQAYGGEQGNVIITDNAGKRRYNKHLCQGGVTSLRSFGYLFEIRGTDRLIRLLDMDGRNHALFEARAGRRLVRLGPKGEIVMVNALGRDIGVYRPDQIKPVWHFKAADKVQWLAASADSTVLAFVAGGYVYRIRRD